jgi:hypothetical protein
MREYHQGLTMDEAMRRPLVIWSEIEGIEPTRDQMIVKIHKVEVSLRSREMHHARYGLA